MRKLIDPKERNLIIEGVSYKPPKQSLQEFLNDHDLLLCIIRLSIFRLSKKNEKCYIMADWNMDYEASVS